MNTILVFPCSMPRALELLDSLQSTGNAVIGASSLDYDPDNRRWPAWVRLPHISDPDFEAAFLNLLDSYKVDGVISLHHVVWNRLRELFARLGREDLLRNRAPIDVEMTPFRQALAKADALLAGDLRTASPLPPSPPMSRMEAASLFHHMTIIPGQSDEDKLAGLYAAARACPAGDVVEIGTLWGRSAFMLGFLSERYAIGPVLCIDPWSATHIVQAVADEVVNRTSATFDTDEALRVFQISLSPYFRGHLNYLRLPSLEAVGHYRPEAVVNSPEFDAVRYAGHIALLHIDGNHALDAAAADIRAWCPHLTDHGWLIMDDYIWTFGDGPQRAVEEYLAVNSDRVVCSFVAGGALFAQLRSPR